MKQWRRFATFTWFGLLQWFLDMFLGLLDKKLAEVHEYDIVI